MSHFESPPNIYQVIVDTITFPKFKTRKIGPISTFRPLFESRVQKINNVDTTSEPNQLLDRYFHCFSNETHTVNIGLVGQGLTRILDPDF